MAFRMQIGGSTGGASPSTAKLTTNSPYKGGDNTTKGAVVQNTSTSRPVPVSPAPAVNVFSTQQNPSGSGAVGGSSGSSGATSTPAATPAPAAPDFSSFLKSYGPYLTQMATFAKALSDYTTSENNQASQYDQQYNQGLKNLGWDASTKSWIKDTDPRYQETAFGNSTNSNDNSFASRGLLQSSAFQQAAQNLLDQYNNQKSQADTGDQTEHTNVNQAIQAYKNQYGTSGTQTQQAKQNAAQAYASQYGVTAPKV